MKPKTNTGLTKQQKQYLISKGKLTERDQPKKPLNRNIDNNSRYKAHRQFLNSIDYAELVKI